MRKKLHRQGTIEKNGNPTFFIFHFVFNSLLFKNPHPHCLNKVDTQYISLSFYSRSFESILFPMRWKLNVSIVRMRIPFGSWIPGEKSRFHSRLRQSYFHGAIHCRIAVNMALSYSFIIFFFCSMIDFPILLCHRRRLHLHIRERGGSPFPIDYRVFVNLVRNYCHSLLSRWRIPLILVRFAKLSRVKMGKMGKMGEVLRVFFKFSPAIFW